MEPRHLEAIVFSVKAAVAAVIAALVYEQLGLPGAPWVAAVSAVLVTQPSLHSSYRASFMRVVANLAGAFGGAALTMVINQPLAAMAIGVMVTGLVCYLLSQDDALRPAFVAVILVTLVGRDDRWETSVDRVLGVLTGCVCALLAGFLFDKLSARFKLWNRDTEKKQGGSE